MTERYAIYFDASDREDLRRIGESWLGRDSTTNEALTQPSVAGFSACRLRKITETARHYGFHATLKPPFELVRDRSADDLTAAIDAFARRQECIADVGLRVGSLDGFMALLLVRETPAVRTLADACVRAFDAFRNPPSAAELERRRKTPLSDRQDMLLERWGYPYVMDAFRFHMTLTGRLPASDREMLRPALETIFGPAIRDGVSINGISLFKQDDRDSAFRRVAYYPFAGATD